MWLAACTLVDASVCCLHQRMTKLVKRALIWVLHVMLLGVT